MSQGSKVENFLNHARSRVPKAFAEWIPQQQEQSQRQGRPVKAPTSLRLRNVNAVVPRILFQRGLEAGGSRPRALSYRERKGRKPCFVYCLLVESRGASAGLWEALDGPA